MRAWNERGRSRGKCGARRDLVFNERKECLISNMFRCGEVEPQATQSSCQTKASLRSASRGVTTDVGVQIPLVWALPE